MTENMALKIFHLNLLLSNPEWIALAIFFALALFVISSAQFWYITPILVTGATVCSYAKGLMNVLKNWFPLK